MNRLGILILFMFLSMKSNCQINCDSTLFKQLIHFGDLKSITDVEFNKCCSIVDTLWNRHCKDFVKDVNGEHLAVTSLTYVFGKICIKANSNYAVKAYIDYVINNKGSAEEQLDFSLENIFVKRPENVMEQISMKDSANKASLLSGLAWGFVNNRYYGSKDIFEDNPYKAMTVYNDPPKVILNTTNYRELYFSLNPEISKIYPTYKKEIDSVLSSILDMLRFDEEQKKNKNN
jgi:hypothetical protein